jgi:pantoate--beta-alanine ligase
MILFKKAVDLAKYLKTTPHQGMVTGFVPTMGALHAGHLSLVKACRESCQLVIASIFVNPTQFNDPKDFARYPITIDKDIAALEQSGCDILFLPDVNEIYPEGTARLPYYDLGYIETVWEGEYRPGHFQGVCQVMDRLLGIVMPQKLFMGRKDYQQCMVIRRLIELKGWQINMRMVDTAREPSGLAMSSRNTRLSAPALEKASIIYRAMQQLRSNIRPGETTTISKIAIAMVMNAGFEKLDYLALADANTLEPVTHWDGERPLVALAAAFIDGVRLIDNMPIA